MPREDHNSWFARDRNRSGTSWPPWRKPSNYSSSVVVVRERSCSSVGTYVGTAFLMVGKLNAKAVQSAKPGRHGDGGGLYLIVKPTLARSWLLRIQSNGRRRDIGLGSIAKMTLAEARERAAELRKHSLNGRDPIVERDRKAFQPKTFREAAAAVHEAKRAGWATKTASSFLASLSEHAYPVLGDLLVEHIDAADIAAALKPVWTSKPAIAAKVRQRIGAVLSYAKASKWRTTETPTQSRSQLLSRQTVSTPMAAMPHGEVPHFVTALKEKPETMGRLVLLFTIATAARGGEVRNAMWSHIDLERRLWNRPANLMKTRVAHVVTLNDLALAILTKASSYRKGSEDALLFPSRTGGALSDMTISKIMRDAGLPYVPTDFVVLFGTGRPKQCHRFPIL
jgi:integrase